MRLIVCHRFDQGTRVSIVEEQSSLVVALYFYAYSDFNILLQKEIRSGLNQKRPGHRPNMKSFLTN